MYEMVAACRDALVLLQNSKRIEYRDGDAWELRPGDIEHPVVPRLRTVILAELNDSGMPVPEPPSTKRDLLDGATDMAHALRVERHVGDEQRRLIFDFEQACRAAGMPDDVVGREVVKWLTKKLTTKTSSPGDSDTSS